MVYILVLNIINIIHSYSLKTTVLNFLKLVSSNILFHVFLLQQLIMAETKNLDSELKRLLKLMNIIDIGLNQNTNWNIQRIIIALLLIISVTINYKMGYIEFFDNNVDISMGFILLVIYWNSFLINCYAVAFALLFRFNDIQILWNNVNDISNLFTKMKILPKMEMRYNFIINGLIYFYQLLVLLYILMTRYKDNQLDFNAYFHIIIIFAHNTLRFAYDMQYCVFISLIKNYYKGINNFLKQRISNKLNIKQMQHIGECHQILIQTSENLQNFMSPIILCQIINSFVIIVTYTYGLICLYVLETSWYAIATTWISLITGFTICVLILPPIHCKNEVFT